MHDFRDDWRAIWNEPLTLLDVEIIVIIVMLVTVGSSFLWLVTA